MFELKEVIIKKDGYAMVACDTRIPWLHMNFGGWEGWRKAINEALKIDGHQGYHIIGRFFEHLIFLDANTTELWLKPKYESGTSVARLGWLYWALCWTKGTWYPNPARAQVDWYEKTVESKLRAWQAESVGCIRAMKVPETYTCCICGQTKKDSESRVSFRDREHKEPFCWECHEIIALEDEKRKLINKIHKMEYRIEDIDKQLAKAKRCG